MERDVSRRGLLEAAAAAAIGGAAMHAAGAEEADEAKTSAGVKIVAVSCSPRKGKNTAVSLTAALKAAAAAGANVQTELIELAETAIASPGEDGDEAFAAVAAKLEDPTVAGILIGTPVYFSSMTALCKAFLDRCMYFRRKDFALADRVAGVVAVGGARNGGQEMTIQSVQAALFTHEMILVGPARPACRNGAAVWSGVPGGALSDKMGMAAVECLGRRVAQVALRVAGSAGPPRQK